jgi:hypothetical protein
MDFDPRTVVVHVRLTAQGKRTLEDAVGRLQHLLPGKPLPEMKLPDQADGWYQMPFWIFARAFGGFNLVSGDWFGNAVVGDVRILVKEETPAPLTCPG